jgi:hypothetical protein
MKLNTHRLCAATLLTSTLALVAWLASNPVVGWSGSLIADEALEFLVSDAETGAPIPNAEIRMYDWQRAKDNSDWITLRTDAEGQASFLRTNCICDQTVRYGKARVTIDLGWCDCLCLAAEGYQETYSDLNEQREKRRYSAEPHSRFNIFIPLSLRKKATSSRDSTP